MREVIYPHGGRRIIGVLVDGSLPRSVAPNSGVDRPRRESRHESSLQRTRTRLLSKFRALCPDYLWTFTKRGKFPDREAAWDAYGRFRALWARSFPNQPWVGIAVPEMHADGEGWHLHVAVRGFYWVGSVRRLWYRALGGTGKETGDQTPGNPQVEAPRRGFSHRAMAYYMAKYLSKGFGHACAVQCKLFESSRAIAKPVINRWREPVTLGIATELAVARRMMPGVAPLPFQCGGCSGFLIDNGVWVEKKRGVRDG